MNRIQKANKKKQLQEIAQIRTKTEEVQSEYIGKIDSDPQYSLEVDPLCKYKMPPEQKKFIKCYTEFKNVNTAADLAGIDMDTAKQYFIAYSSQEEIKRINRAMYHRQFATKLATLDEMGGYLTALLIDEVPIADRLKPTEKLRVIELLLRLNEMKAQSLVNPQQLMSQDLDADLKKLSIASIRNLLDANAKEQEKAKNEAISDVVGHSSLTVEESAYLSTLSTKELLSLIDDNEKKGEDDGTNNESE